MKRTVVELIFTGSLSVTQGTWIANRAQKTKWRGISTTRKAGEMLKFPGRLKEK